MADLNTTITSLVPNEDYEELRKRVVVPDTKTKTKKWLQVQVFEREAKLKSLEAQKLTVEGIMEITEDELDEYRSRLKKLEQL